MRKIFIIFFIISIKTFSQIYKSTETQVSFFSDAPLEDIYAENKDGKSLLNSKTGEIVFIIPIRGFHFENELMEEHFNENYMESDKYKTAYFKGKLDSLFDFNKNGKFNITVTGNLFIHGVIQRRTIPAIIVINNNEIFAESKFLVALADHKIKIPRLVIQKIAEEVEVNVMVKYKQF